MHEVALMEAVVKMASQLAEHKEIDEVRAVHIKSGGLQNMDDDSLRFIFERLRKGRIKDAELIIEKIPAELRCNACHNVWVFDKSGLDDDSLESIHFMPELVHAFERCICGSRDFEILKGRGIWLAGVA